MASLKSNGFDHTDAKAFFYILSIFFKTFVKKAVDFYLTWNCKVKSSLGFIDDTVK